MGTILGFDRRQFLFLTMLLAMMPAAHASDDGGNSGSGSSGSGSDGSGSNSGSGGDDGDSDHSGSGGGDDGNSENSGTGSDDSGDDGDDSGGKSGTDQDDALEAVRDGEIIPLNKALGIVRSRNPGKVIDVSLKRRSFSDVYSFKIKSSTGRITTVRMDARTGRIVGF